MTSVWRFVNAILKYEETRKLLESHLIFNSLRIAKGVAILNTSGGT